MSAVEDAVIQAAREVDLVMDLLQSYMGYAEEAAARGWTETVKAELTDALGQVNEIEKVLLSALQQVDSTDKRS